MSRRRRRLRRSRAWLPEPFHFVAILNATLHRFNPQPLPDTCVPDPGVKRLKRSARGNRSVLDETEPFSLDPRDICSPSVKTRRRARVQNRTRPFKNGARTTREQERPFRTGDNWPRKQLANGSIGLIPSFGIFLRS